MARNLKPSTVLRRWAQLCEKVKNDKTRRKAPGSREAKKHAALAGMRSLLEVEIADQLDKLKVKWEYEPRTFDYHLCPKWGKYCQVQHPVYTPDFYLPDQDIYLECKGKMTLDTRKKMVAVKNHNREIEIKMVFGYANNKLSSAKNATRYWQWAEKEGFDWSDKEIREEWL